jgi:hypothetical protein
MSRENLPPSGTRGGRQAAGVSISTSLSVIVAAIAVLLGFLILRDINRDRTGDVFDPTTNVPTDDSSVDGGETTIPLATPAPNRTGFKVIVANSSGVQGAAGQMTTALQGEQFVVSQPVNADPAVGKLTLTVVYYVPGFESAATMVADVLGGVQILPVPVPPPVETGSLGEAVILVMLGTDLAGKLLPGALPDTPVGTTTTSSSSTVAPAN